MKPILKWAGGKTALLDEIKNRFPEEYNTYFEPFVGGAAVYLSMDNENSIISDKNEELINCYLQVRDQCDAIIPILQEMEKSHSEEKYYELRSTFNLRKLTGELGLYDAALMIYLNKAGFNGMYRENSFGNFNIPSGKKKTVKLYDEKNLKLVSDRLKNATIICCDFEEAVKNAKERDFVYFDSPYDETFSDYQKGGFSRREHERLANLCRELTERNVYFLLSSSDSDFIRELYQGFNISEITVQRMIGFKRDRKIVTELLIKNY